MSDKQALLREIDEFLSVLPAVSGTRNLLARCREALAAPAEGTVRREVREGLIMQLNAVADGLLTASPSIRTWCRDAAKMLASDAALAAPAPPLSALPAEPVAWMYERHGWNTCVSIYRWLSMDRNEWTETPLYAAPPAAEPKQETPEQAASVQLRRRKALLQEIDQFAVEHEAYPVINGPAVTFVLKLESYQELVADLSAEPER